ncbi:hypothetical protein [Streptosporangium sp. OZ121]|uniref:hypothetical protein n=1 Tax=Streptosporangium sp. OZ121 TaxID=3444183 RepID=UPI003F79D200
MQGYAQQAKALADERLASWDDYFLTPRQHALFAEELSEHANEIYAEEKRKMS